MKILAKLSTVDVFSVLLSLGLLLFGKLPAIAQNIAELVVPQTVAFSGLDTPVSVDLDGITHLPESVMTLFEVRNGKKDPVPFQIENKNKRTLFWIIKQDKAISGNRTFVLARDSVRAEVAMMKVTTENGALLVGTDDKRLLQYNFKTQYPPAGIDTVFRRSGFIHPLWTPHGQSLTRINAPDHYHHYGLWNPWTKVLFEGQTIDFWNLKSGLGTVRFADFVSFNSGPVYGDYQTLHKHIVLKTKDGEKVAINELQSVRVYQPGGQQDYYIADITIQLNCASASPVVLQEYRYGGLGWRATEKWNKDNSEILTSDGRGRKEADGSKARWVIVQGSLDQDYGGAVMMSYPTNYNYPEPLRIWPENSAENGSVYANFSPTKDKDWKLEPGKDYVLKYRFLVYNGKFTKEKAEVAWQHFAQPDKVQVKLKKP